MTDDRYRGQIVHDIQRNANTHEHGLVNDAVRTLEPRSSVDDDILVNEEIYVSEHQADEDFLSWDRIALGLLPLAMPSALSIALTFGLAVVPLAFIGSFLGNDSLSGASVGYFIISIFAQYPLCGLTFAMDSFCSQAYGRDPESDEQGVILQRGVLVGILFTIPVSVLLFLIQLALPIFYGEKTAEIARDFMSYGPLFIIPLVTFTAFSKFCLNQFKPQLPMTALVVGIIVTPLVQYFLVKQGVRGAMIGMVIVAWIQLVVMITLTMSLKSTRRTLGHLSFSEALQWDGLKEYLSLAVPSSLFVAAEASAFDVAMLLSASLGVSEGAAFSAILNNLLMFVSLSGGISTATCARIGSSLGARLPRCAWRYVIAAAILVLIISSLNGVIIFVFFDRLLGLFGVNAASLEVAHTVRWIVPFTHIADSAQYVFQGIFSGMGHNRKGAQILITYLWLVGLPLELLFTYVFGWGLAGILGGLTVGLMLESPAMFWYLRNVDWDELSKESSDPSDHRQLEEDPRVNECNCHLDAYCGSSGAYR